MKRLLWLLPVVFIVLIARSQIRPVEGFGSGGSGSGGSTNITTTTNGILNVATNGVKISGVATQANFVAGNNLRILGTNATDKVSLGFAVESNLSFNAAGSLFMIGSDANGAFGISNSTSGRWSMVNSNGASDDWYMPGFITMNYIKIRNVPGSGDIMGVDTAGYPFRTNVSSSGGTTISNANLLFVATDGNNSTALRGRRDLPFLTPVAAKTAASAGDTIVVFPGRYANATNLLKGGVDWIGYNAWLTYTNVTNDAGVGIFDDRFSGAVTSRISGFSFDYSTGYETTNNVYAPAYGPTNVFGCIVETNRLSSLHINFDQLNYEDLKNVTLASAINLLDGTNTYITGNAILDTGLVADRVIGYDPDAMEDVISQSHAQGLYWVAGEHHVAIKRIECRYYSVWVDSVASSVGNLWFTSDKCLGKLYGSGSSTNSWRVWCDIKELRVNSTNIGTIGPVTILGTGKYYLKIDKIAAEKASDTGVLMVASGTGAATCWLDCQKISATGKWIDLSSGAFLYANVLHFEDLGSVDQGITVNGGALRLKGNDCVVTNTHGSALYFGSGDMQAQGLRISTPNSTNAPVLVTTNGLVLQNCTLLAKSGVFSVLATAAKSVNLQGCWGNSPETNNISYLVGPWTVDSNLR